MRSERRTASPALGTPRFFYGWVIVGVATLAMFAATLTGGAGFSVFIQPMAADLGWSRSALVGALSGGTVVGAIVAPIFGRLVDRYGTRLALTGCGLGIAAALAVVSGVRTELAFFVAYGLARAIDMGALNIAATTAVANWFVRRRGRALGITMTGNALGVMLLVPIAQWLIEGPGWRTAWLVLGVGSGLSLALSAGFLLRRRPEDLGLRPDGDPPAEGRVAAPTELASAIWTPARAIRTSAFWLLVLASAGGHLAVSGLTTHQAAVLIERGITPAAAAGAVSLYGLGWTFGSLAWGLVIERLLARRALALASLLVAVCGMLLLVVRDPVALVFYAILYGVANGAKEALDAGVWAEYFGRHSVGAIRGLSRPVVVGAGALGSFGGGVGYDLAGGYGPAVVALSLVALTAAGAALLARPPVTLTPAQT